MGANLKKAVILFCFLGLFLKLTACGANINYVPVETIYVPIEGINEVITASGYIEINDSRYSPSPPSATFHPYPGYFHLFPFAALEPANLPVFVLTNDVDEIFDLLGKAREDVQSDRFGNQRLDNISAVFDSFSTREIIIGDTNIGLGIVFADMIGIADSENFWEIKQTDFILFTNGNRTIEPVELRVGEEFLGFLLTRIESSHIYMKNGQIYHQLLAEAEMSGQITLTGDFIIGLRFDSEYRIYTEFIIDAEYFYLLPRIADFGGNFDSFSISNLHELMTALGITQNALDAYRRIEFTGTTALFDISWVSSFGYVAKFVELQ